MDDPNEKSTEQCTRPPDEVSHALPSAPNPSADPGVIPQIGEGPGEDAPFIPEAGFDIFGLEPLNALKLLSKAVQTLADLTGDVPPTPPVSRPGTPSASSIRERFGHRRAISKPANAPSNISSDDVKSSLRESTIGSPEAHVMEPDCIGDTLARANDKVRYEAIARKFFSKKPPPISVNEYLLRMHRYCPMSTAVYLAAGAYLYRMAIEDKSVPVTARTIHRLLVATLRIAMKALEDLSYPHKRFAGVGGVTERELAKLEISVCYLLDFELRCTAERLQEKAVALHQFATAGTKMAGAATMQLTLPTRARSNRRLTVS